MGRAPFMLPQQGIRLCRCIKGHGAVLSRLNTYLVRRLIPGPLSCSYCLRSHPGWRSIHQKPGRAAKFHAIPGARRTLERACTLFAATLEERGCECGGGSDCGVHGLADITIEHAFNDQAAIFLQRC